MVKIVTPGGLVLLPGDTFTSFTSHIHPPKELIQTQRIIFWETSFAQESQKMHLKVWWLVILRFHHHLWSQIGTNSRHVWSRNGTNPVTLWSQIPKAFPSKSVRKIINLKGLQNDFGNTKVGVDTTEMDGPNFNN